MKNKALSTTTLTIIAVLVIVACAWGLKSLYFDLPPLKLQTASDNADITEDTQTLSLPKLFIYTSDLNPQAAATEEAAPAEGGKKELSDNDMILRVILQNKHRLQRCYENHLRNQPDSRGEIHLALHMTPIGKVQSIRVEKTDFANDPLFPSCLESVIKRLRFKLEKANKSFIISIPLEFQ